MTLSLYQTALGAHFAQLAAPLQAFHAPHAAPLRCTGWVSIKHGPHWLCKVLAALMRLPKPCVRGECEVLLTQTAQGHEVWQRRMNGQNMVSQQTAAPQTPQAGCVLETAFPYTITLANRVGQGALWQRSVGGRLLGIPLPSAVHMRVAAVERAVGDAGFSFDVRLYLPWRGRLLSLMHYCGELGIVP